MNGDEATYPMMTALEADENLKTFRAMLRERPALGRKAERIGESLLKVTTHLRSPEVTRGEFYQKHADEIERVVAEATYFYARCVEAYRRIGEVEADLAQQAGDQAATGEGTLGIPILIPLIVGAIALVGTWKGLDVWVESHKTEQAKIAAEIATLKLRCVQEGGDPYTCRVLSDLESSFLGEATQKLPTLAIAGAITFLAWLFFGRKQRAA